MSKLNEKNRRLYATDTTYMNDNKLSAQLTKIELLSSSEHDSEKLKIEELKSLYSAELFERNDRKNNYEKLRSASEKFLNEVYSARNDVIYGDMRNCLASDRIDRQYYNYLTNRNVAVDFTIHYSSSKTPPQRMSYIGKYKDFVDAIMGNSKYVLQEDAKSKTACLLHSLCNKTPYKMLYTSERPFAS